LVRIGHQADVEGVSRTYRGDVEPVGVENLIQAVDLELS